MDEDATWYGSRPRRRPHCIRRVPSVSAKGAQHLPLLDTCYGRPSQLLLSSCYFLTTTPPPSRRHVVFFFDDDSRHSTSTPPPTTSRCFFRRRRTYCRAHIRSRTVPANSGDVQQFCVLRRNLLKGQQCWVCDITSMVRNKLTFGDINVQAHVMSRLHYCLDVLCDGFLRAAKGDVVHVS